MVVLANEWTVCVHWRTRQLGNETTSESTTEHVFSISKLQLVCMLAEGLLAVSSQLAFMPILPVDGSGTWHQLQGCWIIASGHVCFFCLLCNAVEEEHTFSFPPGSALALAIVCTAAKALFAIKLTLSNIYIQRSYCYTRRHVSLWMGHSFQVAKVCISTSAACQ